MNNSSSKLKSRRHKKRPVTVEDVKCSICLEILILPVSLSCGHALCKMCFEGNCNMANFECPICRVRLSSWARKAKRNGLLLDKEKWEEIQRLFPAEIAKRLNEEEQEFEKSLLDTPSRKRIFSSISKPGEIKTEFEEMMKKFKYDQEQKRLQEERASEEYIKKLLLNDKTPLLNDSMSQNSSNNTMPRYSINYVADLEKPSSSTSKPKLPNPRSSSVESCDSISQEMSHFKPINAAPLTPPKKTSDGRELLRPKVICTVVKQLNFEGGKAQQENSHVLSEKQVTNCHRDDEDIYPLRENSNFLKSRDMSTSTSWNTFSKKSLKHKRELLKQGKIDEQLNNIKMETAMFEKIEQEKADFVLAQRLQEKYKKLPCKVDRTKGSGNEYNFRQRPK